MKAKLRRSGAKIMASLIVLLGSLSYIMILAVINGSVGFIAAMGVTVAGATGVAKALGIMGLCAEVSLSWGWIIGIAVGCGTQRQVEVGAGMVGDGHDDLPEKRSWPAIFRQRA